MQRVSVPLADRTYDVVVGAGAIDQIGSLVPERAQRLAVVTQAGIPERFADIEQFVDGREVEVFEIGVGESSKSLATIEQLQMAFDEDRGHRDRLVKRSRRHLGRDQTNVLPRLRRQCQLVIPGRMIGIMTVRMIVRAVTILSMRMPMVRGVIMAVVMAVIVTGGVRC